MLRETGLSETTGMELPKEQRIYVARNRGNDELAPGGDLYAEFDARKKQLEEEFGKRSAEAHNQAFLDCHYERRFREQIFNDPEALAKLQALCDRARQEDIYFICYEGPAKACHRRILLRICEERFSAEVIIEGVEPHQSTG
jgi:hypothetical protein